MNLNKFTKAELIQRFRKLETKHTENTLSNNSSIFVSFMKTLLYFKSLILKITLIAVLIKIFKKYSIIGRIWRVFNAIIMSIFGISFVDIYGSDVINSILDIFRSTAVYSWFSGLLGGKVIETPSKLKQIDINATRVEKDPEIIKRFKQIINKEEVIIPEEPTPFYKDGKTYAGLALLLLLLGLGYYYREDLAPIPGEFLSSIRRLWSKPGDTTGTPGNLDSGHPSPNLLRSIKDAPSNLINKIKAWWNKDKPDTFSDNDSIGLGPSPTTNSLDRILPIIDKGKTIDPAELSTEEINRRLMTQISGNTQTNFDGEAVSILNQVDQFTKSHEKGAFPTPELELGMWNVIRGRIAALYALTPALYDKWTNNKEVDNKIHNFVELESQINPDYVKPPVDPIKPKEMPDDQKSFVSYDAVAHATAQEQDAWSDTAQSRVQSPKTIQEVLTEGPKNIQQIITDAPKNSQGVIIEQSEGTQEVEVEDPRKSRMKDLFKVINKRRDNNNNDLKSVAPKTGEMPIKLDPDNSGSIKWNSGKDTGFKVSTEKSEAKLFKELTEVEPPQINVADVSKVEHTDTPSIDSGSTDSDVKHYFKEDSDVRYLDSFSSNITAPTNSLRSR